MFASAERILCRYRTSEHAVLPSALHIAKIIRCGVQLGASATIVLSALSLLPASSDLRVLECSPSIDQNVHYVPAAEELAVHLEERAVSQ